eukprot:gene13179-17657_t
MSTNNKRNKQTKRKDDDDEDDDEVEVKPTKGSKKTTEKESNGLNWTAIFIMMLFALPVLLAGVIQATDYFYPEAARERQLKERVLKCYESANPSKLAEVDKFVQRYKGREEVLFAQLRNKYPKHPECQQY